MKRSHPTTAARAHRRTTRTTPRARSLDPSSAESAPPGRNVSLKLWTVLARSYTSVSRHLEADVARHELTLTEFGILEALYHKGPLLLGEIQRTILVTSGGITYLVDRLTAKGLVERQDCPKDRRARYAVLTPAGTALIQRIFPEHAHSIERALSGLSADEQTRAAALLRTLGRAAAALPPAPDGS